MGRYRIEFSKGPEVRFISHLELMRAFERAFRRAKLPIAFSEGFNPHPKMSFASALAVGVTSAREYLDIELKENLEPKDLLLRLQKSLPPGLALKGCIPIAHKEQALMAMVASAHYRVRVKLLSPFTQAQIEDAIKILLQKESLIIETRGKKGPKPKELRPGIFELACLAVNEGWAELILKVQSGSQGNIRPEEVIKALKEIAQVPLDLDLTMIHRTGLFKEGQGDLFTPTVL